VTPPTTLAIGGSNGDSLLRAVQQEVPMLFTGPTTQITPFHGESGHGSLGPSEFTPQTACRSVGVVVLWDSRSRSTNMQTQTQTRTTKRQDICSNEPHPRQSCDDHQRCADGGRVRPRTQIHKKSRDRRTDADGSRPKIRGRRLTRFINCSSAVGKLTR